MGIACRESPHNAAVRVRGGAVRPAGGLHLRWTVFEASSLRNNPLNARQLLEQERISRGEILAANGTVLARSLQGREGTYTRTYPTGSLFAHPLGYYFTNLGASGLEKYRNDVLEGQTQSNLQTILNQLQGVKPAGDKVITSLDPSAQRVAQQALGEHHGAVVALDPRTGAVKVMVSNPSYRTERAALPGRSRPRRAQRLGRARQPCHPGRLRPGLDLQGRHRHGRHRHRPLHARIDRQRARRGADLRPPPVQRPARELRPDHPHRRARALRQHGLRPGRREPRQARHGPLHAPLRLQPRAQARLPRHRNVGQRRVRERAPDPAHQPAGGRRPHGHRPGQTRGHRAADGAGRIRGRRRRAPDGAPPHEQDRGPRRAHRRRRSAPSCRRS